MMLRLCYLPLLLACSGCASAPALPLSAAAQTEARQTCAAVSQLELQGRLSVRYEHGEGKQQSMQANFTWRQQAQELQILLSNPLGQGMAQVSVTAGGAQFTDMQGAQHVAADVDALSEKLLGWPLPVAGLRDWLRGCGRLADGNLFQAHPQGADSFYSADGWRIRYASWHDNGQPKRIDLERRINQQEADVFLRILLDARS
ncbi:lipoprotein insertase outer membrane protein LolB [Massilia sp. W12]|uniref:lipoprotein insertase outer membrane protein LolB n=1 Tax=Massilia sp. W12 TaxID=3126507 RepID=UPI0030CF68D1